MEQELEMLRKVARTWNNLNTCYIKNDLAADVVYQSQWVLTPIVGKEPVLTFLDSKFFAIKSAMKSESIIVNAQLALLPAIQNKPCLVVYQSDKEGNRKVSILIKIQEGELKRIDICFIPDPLEAILLEEPI